MMNINHISPLSAEALGPKMWTTFLGLGEMAARVCASASRLLQCIVPIPFELTRVIRNLDRPLVLHVLAGESVVC